MTSGFGSGIPGAGYTDGAMSDGQTLLARIQTTGGAGFRGVYTVHSGAWTAYSPLQPDVVFVRTGTALARTHYILTAANTYLAGATIPT
jgi:hypothetical protein